MTQEGKAEVDDAHVGWGEVETALTAPNRGWWCRGSLEARAQKPIYSQNIFVYKWLYGKGVSFFWAQSLSVLL